MGNSEVAQVHIQFSDVIHAFKSVTLAVKVVINFWILESGNGVSFSFTEWKPHLTPYLAPREKCLTSNIKHLSKFEIIQKVIVRRRQTDAAKRSQNKLVRFPRSHIQIQRWVGESERL